MKGQLEEYFFNFPPELLQFDRLTYGYHAEAMIWLHGMFLMLYASVDVINILKDEAVAETERFVGSLDHALLLGEVLPALTTLNPNLEAISSATVFFIMLSCAFHAVALREFFVDDNAMSDRILTGAPEKLMTSSKTHMQLLVDLRTRCQQFDSPLLDELRDLLSACLARASGRAFERRMITCGTLMHYRWCGKGTGIARMKTEKALQEWKYQDSPETEL